MIADNNLSRKSFYINKSCLIPCFHFSLSTNDGRMRLYLHSLYSYFPNFILPLSLQNFWLARLPLCYCVSIIKFYINIFYTYMVTTLKLTTVFDPYNIIICVSEKRKLTMFWSSQAYAVSELVWLKCVYFENIGSFWLL